MGRGKIEIKRIENSSNRQVTYSKRRNGIIKKAKEITVLCDAHVSLVVFASSGKMHEYCSPSMQLVDILDKYHKQSGKRLWDAKHENLSNELDRVKKENDNMQIELRHLRGEDITSLNYKELMALEQALENGLIGVREKQSEFMKMMRTNYQKEMEAMGECVREMDNGYNQRMRDFNSQMPFAFRVQPIQPNLQERI
ncbi:floral homeotic protein PMADS 2-like isoform X2 [Cucurbita moschata]|uniref:Floral homeotic protein PMADS 2-like isoform X2 n=1 Tax=Cucurbita moschata TaxID=3662 RepID=A0A6J1FMG1_CUCMO|nr:floral homeotic protein PMADS 2-like isoform X2 [Cucurbita moschata]